MDEFDDHVLACIFNYLDVRSRCNAMAVCRVWGSFLCAPETWADLSIRTSDDMKMDPADLMKCIKRASGCVTVLRFERSDESAAAQNRRRFDRGMRRNDVPAVTRGPRAAAFAALLPRLRELTLDEGASCIGGFNDDLARALAASAPGLRRLCVSFPDDYSLAAELFTDEGLIRLAEGCPQLQSLSLRHCSHVTDRSLYSLAANCRQLAELRVGGYHERITDSGLGILFDACGDRLKVVRLSGKLVKATDGSVEVLAKRCGGLEELKLSRSAGDAALRALACGACRATLRDLELHRCSATTREVAAALLLACPALQRCTLPAHFGPTWVSQALAAGGRRADVRASDAGVDPKGCSSHSSPLLRVSFQ